MKNKQGLLATKVGMTQLFLEDGVCVPVTVLKINDNIVVSKLSVETDGYDAVQFAYGEAREKVMNKPHLGLFAKKKIQAKRHLREFRVSKSMLDNFEEGQMASLSWLNEIGSLDVSGVSKGKGFAGVMKRHNFAGYPATHGTHEIRRGGGSIGNRNIPGRVFPGKKMAGQMGNERITVKNVRIVKFIEDEKILCLRGGIPGGKGALIELRASTRKPKIIQGVAGPKEEKGLKNPMKASKAGAGKKK